MSVFHPHSCSNSFISVSMDSGAKTTADTNSTNGLCFKDTKERIKKMFGQIELSVSSYDTAWVAMVPSPTSPHNPCFPACLNWLPDNQLPDDDGGIGEEQMKKGLLFIESHFGSVSDENQLTPIGFDIIFSGMVEYAKDLNLNLPLRSTDIDALFHKRDLELRRENSKGREAYLAYVSEGIGKQQDWEMVMKYQRKNGSLFNSPSTTAAALSHIPNAGCLCYLTELLKKFENAVPTVHPFHIYPRLCMVETIESLGIGQHFREEIASVLDETYRCWMQGEEEIFLDPVTCAMALQILRLNGYDVSSESLTGFAEEHFFNSLRGYLKDLDAVIELFKASQMIIHPNEQFLEKQVSWTSHFLKRELSNGSTYAYKHTQNIIHKVNDALEFSHYASLERLVHRRNIVNYAVDDIRMLKSSYCSSSIGNKDFLRLAVEDFNACQSIYREELEQLERWVREERLDKLKFARQKLAYCYFSAAATICSPDLSDARISWAKNGVLTTVVDDFFDVGGSEDELLNLIQLVEKHDLDTNIHCCSEEVEIIFSALHSTISEIGEKAIAWQGRNVKTHVTKIWLDLLRSMLQEAQWLKQKAVPTVNKYMTNGYISFALGPIILPALYFVGPRLSEDVVKSDEYNLLYKHVSTCGRLPNDIHSFKRESMEGKLNARNGIVPRQCKELFWKMSKVLHLFYVKDDGFTSHEMVNVVNAVIHEPVFVDEL
ncbi:GA REQUIRING 2, ENT-KAURENE SYNTHASE 1, ARABIDOPSIS THALIANA ENT-KAURENE SYNTHASE 1 [Hibiscus trionum]|uniref:GA REQUIRING 2, ENT-KAURENE SYNTHASE 1, ARABIDOPSIS THALIANA ENT-KAURENE SYNTHASE 1 n=1 Tax=Hibiscus trionum TaxID=183268 RepID=A0A9W7J9M5_HIBTR|nr:GA REQUIRING 2, ENT-KAURENE SYNTHASE 1, ARABIDOPSIS THALIANA ENT-KAURENE SYNTHASE 1 [Hibiscus trionum]